MKNLPFAIWMLCWLPANSLSDYLALLANGGIVKRYSADTEGIAALVVVALWIVVGSLLYERRRS